MGGVGPSRILSYPEAESRLGDERVQGIDNAFRRVVSARRATTLDQTTFRTTVLAAFPGIPMELSLRIFRAFTPEGAMQISLEDFICGVAILASGSTDERAQFTFFVMDMTRLGMVTTMRLHEFYNTLYGRRRVGGRRADEHVNDLLAAASVSHSADITASWFREACAKLPSSPFLSWMDRVAPFLLGEQEPRGLENPAYLLHLARASASANARLSRFSDDELHALRVHYAALKRRSPSGHVDAALLHSFVAPPKLPRAVANSIARVMGAGESTRGVVPLAGYLEAVALMSRGDLNRRFSLVFRLFDRDGDGKLSAEELAALETELSPLRASAKPAARGAVDAAARSILPAGAGPAVSSASTAASALGRMARSVSQHVPLRRASSASLSAVLETVSSHKGTLTRSQALSMAREVLEELGTPHGMGARVFVTRYAVHSPAAMGLASLLRRTATVHLGVRPSSPEEERELLTECYRPFDPRALAPGDTWYVVAMDWWVQWARYVGWWEPRGNRPGRGFGDPNAEPGAAPRPPHPVRNKPVMDTALPGALVKGITIDHDYKLLPEAAWLALSAWYDSEHVALPRKVVRVPPDEEEEDEVGGEEEEGEGSEASGRAAAEGSTKPGNASPERGAGRGVPLRHSKSRSRRTRRTSSAGPEQYELELYPLALVVCPASLEGRPLQQRGYTQLFSKVLSAADAHDECCRLLGVSDPARARVHVSMGPGPDAGFTYLPRGEEALEELDVDDGYLLLVAIQQPDGSWPEPASAEDVEGGEQRPTPARKGVPGRVGLANLGNTCYMNAALQCLAHTRPLTEYFLSGDFVYDVNTVNKAGMGMQGRLAVAFASLVRDMWSGRRMAVAPWQFKRVFGKFKPEFNGFDQQDSQEFLQLVLTGLGEDLNRVGAKPYSEQPDSDGRPDSEVAAEWWANHWRRECSVITKLFSGQFRSVLRCLTCGHESARFEPFQMLQLPLPERSTRSLRVVLVPPHRAFPVQLCAVTVPNTGTVADVTAALVRMRPLQGVQLSVDNVVVCEVVNHAIGVVYRSDHPLARLTEAGLHAFVLPEAPPVPVYGRRLRKRERKAVAALERARLSPIPEGTRVRVRLRSTGQLSPATVLRRRAGESYDLDLEDGGAEERRVPRTCIVHHPRPRLPVGTPVHGRWRANPRNPLYPGYVSRALDDGTYDVSYNDGDSDAALPADAVTPRRLQPAALVVFQRRLVEDKGHYHVRFRPQLFACPFFLYLCPELHTYRQLYRAVWEQLRGRAKPTSPPLSEEERLAAAADDPMAPMVGGHGRRDGDDDEHHNHHQKEEEEEEDWNLAEVGGEGSAEAVPEEPRTAGMRATDRAGPPYAAGVASSDRVEVEEVEAAPEEGDSEAAPSADGESRGDPTPSPTSVDELSPAAEWGFTLREVDGGGVASPQHWMTASYGEDLPCTDTMMRSLRPGAMLAVDWEPRVVEEQFSLTVANDVAQHKSVKEAEEEAEQRLSLQRCVQSFVGVERLEGDSEAYCSKCEAFRAQTKKLDLWRAPPFLIVQLKRFQFNRVSRRKLNNHVEFPTRGLDLRPYMARDVAPVPPPDLTWWRHLGGRMQPAPVAGHAAHAKAPASPPQRPLSGGAAAHRHTTPARAGLAKADAPSRPLGGPQRGDSTPSRRKSPKEECAGAAGEEAEENGGVDMVDAARQEGRHDLIYDLQGVVNHMGVMGAGHYIAYIREDESGQWLSFNDSSHRPIDEAQVQSPSAYLLFYVRKDVSAASVRDLFPRDPTRSPVDISQIGNKRISLPTNCSIQ